MWPGRLRTLFNTQGEKYSSSCIQHLSAPFGPFGALLKVWVFVDELDVVN
jgi:hypothetical protein